MPFRAYYLVSECLLFYRLPTDYDAALDSDFGRQLSARLLEVSTSRLQSILTHPVVVVGAFFEMLNGDSSGSRTPRLLMFELIPKKGKLTPVLAASSLNRFETVLWPALRSLVMNDDADLFDCPNSESDDDDALAEQMSVPRLKVPPAKAEVMRFLLILQNGHADPAFHNAKKYVECLFYFFCQIFTPF